MPRKTKAEIQATLASIMEVLLAASAALEHSLSDEDMSDSANSGDTDNNDAEILLLAGMESMDNVTVMFDGSRGPYGKIPKSKDWFSTALRSPDRDFRRIFRCVAAKV